MGTSLFIPGSHRLNIRDIRQRSIALFLFALMFAGASIPTASAYAATQPVKLAAPVDQGDPDSTIAPAPIPESKQKLPDIMPETRSGYKAPDTTLSPVSREDVAGKKLLRLGEVAERSKKPADPSKRIELIEKRSATKEVFRNSNGSYTEKTYFSPKYYQKENKWVPINSTLIEDKNADDSGNVLGKLYGQAQSVFDSEQAFKVKENDWQARFASSDFGSGMVRVQKGKDQLGFSPVGAKRVAPVITTDGKGRQTVHYYDLWPGVNVEYTVNGGQLKENIILKDKNAVTDFTFKVAGAELTDDGRMPGAFKIAGELGSAFSIMPVNLVLQQAGYIDSPVYGQDYKNGQLHVWVDKTYIKGLPAGEFPAVVDPTIGSAVGWGADYVNIKSTGAICYSNSCPMYAGSLNDGTAWRQWRTFFHVPTTYLNSSTDVLNATVVLNQDSGTAGARSFQVLHASCTNSYYCVNWGLPGGTASLDGYGELDATNIYQTALAGGEYGAWLALVGQECNCQSYKAFDPSSSGLVVTYNNRPTMPVPDAPSTNPNQEAVVTTTQPLLGITPSSDADGDVVVYDFQILSTTGVVLYDTDTISANRLTVPEGLLQDGGVYNWRFAISDQTYYSSGWRNGGIIRVDLRTGKDKTSTYQDVGPVSVSLNSGNVYTNIASHNIKAIDGDIGLSLNYNSPMASRIGLNAAYYNNNTISGDPVMRRIEATIDNSWNSGTPAQNIVSLDNFSAKYTGYFVAPESGAYYFGGINDDGLKITVNGQVLYNGACYTQFGPCYGSSVTLAAGQTVPFSAEYIEYSGPAYAHVYVKGPVAETIIKSEWLRTAPMHTEQNTGLTGHYYKDNGSHDPAQLTEKFMVRQDPSINFLWGVLATVPNTQADNFYVRWEGYFTPQVSGSYTFGTSADDGSRIKIGASTVMSNWVGGGYGQIYGSSVMLTQGVPVPITVEYFELTGEARMQLYAKGPTSPDGAVVGAQYLSPGGKFLPAGWSLSADADGNLAYERLEVRQNGDVIMYDADGSTQLFTNTGSGFKPPVNEDAYLVRNQDASYSLTDVDGRVYIFNVDGTLRETSTPIDDRKPAAIRYNYATQNGIPKLTEIVDGVTNARKGNLYYGGDTQCAPPPSGFSATPVSTLCAFITSDSQRTDFFYNADGQLARVGLPGNAAYDVAYDQDSHLLSGIRDVLANDAIAAGVRANDATVKTEVLYENQLLRATTIKAPAPTVGASRATYAVDYLPNKSKLHIAGSVEPNGYSQYIEYDNLLRTTKNCDVAALCDTTEWHATKDLPLSSTDETGLKSTIVYDDDDKPVHQYGPAPSAWFAADRTPLSTNTSQIPHTETKYDEGITGPAVAYQSYSATNKTLVGAPKLHATNVGGTAGTITRNWGSISPLPDGTAEWGMRATGKMRLPAAGTYRFRINSDNGARLWIDDQLVVDDWNDGAIRDHPDYNYANTAGSLHRFQIEYYHRPSTSASASFSLKLTPPAQAETTAIASWFTPSYGLATTSKVFDATLGDSIVTTNYGSSPELSLAQSTSQSPAGLNLTTSMAYEAPGAADSFLRQTGKTLPGGGTTSYAYYGSAETKDNPCTTGTTEAYKQAGFLKLKTEPDPDGAGSLAGRKAETIYNDAGQVIASRYNTDSWTCATYDSRGRVTQTAIPTYNASPARTIQSDYSVGGNPLITTTWDGNGWIVIWSDLLGRTTQYRDVYDDETTTSYDNFGRVAQRVSPMGTEAYVYDNYNRLTQQKLDGTIYATVTYDAYSRIDHVNYNNAGATKLTPGRDSLGRANSYTYLLGNGTTSVSDTVTRTQSGQIITDVVASGASNLWYNYGYDAAGRLTSASVGPNTYTYGFGTASSACNAVAGNNATAGKNSNRTTQTINGATTTFCYDQADRLMASSNALYNNPTYDTHGNMTQIGTGTTPLRMSYDSSNRSTGYEQYDATTTTGVGLYYDRDVQGRIIGRYKNTITNGSWAGAGSYFYHYTGSGDAPDYVRDQTWAITEKNIQLPGGVLLTLKPQEPQTNDQKQYSLPNIHGDTLITTNAQGTNTSTGNGPANTFTYDPFGSVLPGSTLPSNTAAASYAYVGQHQKITESTFALTPMSMGARTYLPQLGRFTQVDPIEGGTENTYVYPTDPVNELDLSGTIGLKKWFKDRAKNAQSIGKKIQRGGDRVTSWCNGNKVKSSVCDIGFAAMTAGRAKRGSSSSGFSGRQLELSLSALKLGYNKRIPATRAPFNSHGQPVFQKGNRYISPDVDGHTGNNAWKVYEMRSGRPYRIGTYDSSLKNKIGD